jgi:hypothetical protein
MVDVCRIERQTGETTDEYGRVTPVMTLIYAGKCRVMSWAVATTSPNVGQQRVDLLRMDLHVPTSVAGVEVNDVATITSSRDPDLVGRRLRVDNLAHKTDATARRFPVEEVTS